jgi:putative solute:sodium symporter small subunit
MTPAQQVSYWRGSLRIVAAVLGVWLGVSALAAVLFADWLDRVKIGAFPLGFWFGQQGAVIAFVAIVWVYVALMNALDRRHGVFER